MNQIFFYAKQTFYPIFLDDSVVMMMTRMSGDFSPE